MKGLRNVMGVIMSFWTERNKWSNQLILISPDYCHLIQIAPESARARVSKYRPGRLVGKSLLYIRSMHLLQTQNTSKIPFIFQVWNLCHQIWRMSCPCWTRKAWNLDAYCQRCSERGLDIDFNNSFIYFNDCGLHICNCFKVDIRGIFRYANCYPTAIAMVASGKVSSMISIGHWTLIMSHSRWMSSPWSLTGSLWSRLWMLLRPRGLGPAAPSKWWSSAEKAKRFSQNFFP